MNIKSKASIIKIWIFALFLFISFPIFSQNSALDDNVDFETWSSIEIQYKPTKKLSLALEEQLRLKENSSVTDQYFTQLQVEYEAFKNFEFGCAFRYIKKNDTRGNIQGYEDHFRFHLDGSYNHKINQFSFKYRFRYQNKNELGISSSEGDYPNQHLRFKTSVDYKIKNWKLDPKFSAEIFNHFEKGETDGFDKYRLTIGTDYKLKKIGKLSLYYRLERELNIDNPKTINIIKLKYTYTFKSY
jgi:hypothetical protein